MPDKENQLVNEWLTRLNDLQPADGSFTEGVLTAAGPFPVHRPPGDPYDYRDDDKGSYQYHVAIVARRYALEMARYYSAQAALRAAGASGDEAAKHNANELYWSQITAWLETIQIRY
jgi:hypothetical protein